MSIERYIYACRLAEGALTGAQVANAELSVANLDETHAQYELPYREVYINGTLRTLTDLQLLKSREQSVMCPLHKPSKVNPYQLYTTNKGSLEFDTLKIPLNGSMPEITGRFI